MKKIINLTILLLVVATILTQVVSIYMSNTTALDSVGATKLQSEISSLSEENIQLQANVLGLSSYNNVASRAADLGFQETNDLISVYDPVSVAIR